MEFNKKQKEKLADVMESMWGAHFQTGVDANKIPYLYARLGPNLPLHRFSFHLNGKVREENNFGSRVF